MQSTQDTQPDPQKYAQGRSLGRLQLRDIETNEIVLVPRPSSDPNDPLNWCVFVENDGRD